MVQKSENEYHKTSQQIRKIEDGQEKPITHRERMFLNKYKEMLDCDKIIIIETLFKYRNPALIKSIRENFKCECAKTRNR